MSNTSVEIEMVSIPDLKKKAEGSEEFLNKILSPAEMANSTTESIAGIIAAKMAVIKTGCIGPGEWREISILSDPNGKPTVLNENGRKIENVEVSISHTRELAIAVAVYLKD
jgi:phosphopantetheine--protein transferase-like protein